MIGYGVTPQQVQAGAQSAAAIADEISVGLDQLRQFVASLRGSWEGVAQLSFDELMQRWALDAQNLHNALVGISNGLDSTYQNYTTSELANNQAVQNVSASMPPARLG
ncbi:WXG100 family type VII secretion target [Micromonospora sp. NBC_01813]|uniref:WXG100 family type VII secretion target n=1 Tax=Micromonospora sp. NBC_01813 TaxID=2975988 RepID=UPI002DDB41F2|nr:WXG100 family type VII secretion target [Micromonospora sp. NBC_01813]WSA07152.1 WXG100 family type VII secretion target [Micromonospora sp. NBC_01813]